MEQRKKPLIHPWPVRLTHWLTALAVFGMVTSGWRIYNASPLFGFSFPEWMTLGGWLGGALQWHFATMWLLFASFALYLVYGLAAGRFRLRFWPVTPRAVWRDSTDFFRGRLSHTDLAVYNGVQKLAYLGAILTLILLILSGVSVWKPIQLQELANLMGGYEGARRVHFFAMGALVAFVVIHILMALAVPRSLLAMIRGR